LANFIPIEVGVVELIANTYLYNRRRAVAFNSVNSVPNFDSLEGYIELKVDGTDVLTAAESDDVRDFWLLIVRMLPRVASTGKATMVFPGSPSTLSIARKGDAFARISCSVDPARTAVLGWDVLARRLGDEADAFLGKLISLGYPEWELAPDVGILKAFGELVGVGSWGQRL
jgi:hypothetical protein